MSRGPVRSLWQEQFLADLDAVARAHPELVIVRERRRLTDAGEMPVQLGIHTGGLVQDEGGLDLEPTEIVEISIPANSSRPPLVHVTHSRFVGYPHVLCGMVLCIYLDPNREWNPGNGAAGFLNRLWGWFADAAAGKFDPHTSLYHAIGGTSHATASTPTVVIRDEIGKNAGRATLVDRTDRRFDFTVSDGADGLRAPIVTAPAHLPLGTGTTLFELAMLLDDPTLSRGGQPAPGVPTKAGSLSVMLIAAAKRNPESSPQPFILAVPHPAGGAPHILVGALTAEVADALRSGGEPGDPTLDWWRVSDERPSVTTRRDSTRPTASFVGRTVMIFGCGGLGSWIAEFVARAGAKGIVLSDPAAISGGLLVRQNFLEEDIGASKQAALAARLRAIRDDLDVDILGLHSTGELHEPDLAIDATVNMAFGQFLASLSEHILVAQVAVDPRTASVGMVLVKPAGSAHTMAQLDARAGSLVGADPSLEEYHSMWSSGTHGMLVPTRGCSVPTFHGSAADLAAAAGVMVSLLATQLLEPTAGVHLFTLPHAASTRTRTSVFLPLQNRSDAAGDAKA
ncbi:ThiF family adenylyltransferase [Herbiconiux moechotypicola]|uniref:ThiF family adenylyltransferase n=1 Tax=Herbiconiux moechotypicola TaxID=637393 RepID=A0ABN3DGM3_9MICO|nr:ThiF family adenylyltransferase [Herbiconiux moechotypicola]MCS5729548.1 ThiF family adenylyltransferase [Herbiconiux moechotypicola]